VGKSVDKTSNQTTPTSSPITQSGHHTTPQIDLHWVRALTVPTHLGLTDGPFVPCNPISAQQSPVPLSKLQMTPRLKILMSSGSKKGTQIHHPFLSKSPGQLVPSRFPKGPLRRERYPLTGHFYISLDISL